MNNPFNNLPTSIAAKLTPVKRNFNQPYQFNAPTNPAIGQTLNDMAVIGQDIANLGPIQRGATKIATKLGAPPKVAGMIGFGATMATPLGMEEEVGRSFMSIDNLVSHEGAPDAEQVAKYVEQLKAGKKLEPVKIIDEGGGKFGVEDGKHRLEAYRQVGNKMIPVEKVEPKRYTKDSFGRFTGSKSILRRPWTQWNFSL